LISPTPRKDLHSGIGLRVVASCFHLNIQRNQCARKQRQMHAAEIGSDVKFSRRITLLVCFGILRFGRNRAHASRHPRASKHSPRLIKLNFCSYRLPRSADHLHSDSLLWSIPADSSRNAVKRLRGQAQVDFGVLAWSNFDACSRRQIRSTRIVDARIAAGSSLRNPGGKRRGPRAWAHEHKILAWLQLGLPEFALLIGACAAGQTYISGRRRFATERTLRWKSPYGSRPEHRRSNTCSPFLHPANRFGPPNSRRTAGRRPPSVDPPRRCPEIRTPTSMQASTRRTRESRAPAGTAYFRRRAPTRSTAQSPGPAGSRHRHRCSFRGLPQPVQRVLTRRAAMQ